MSRGFAGRVDHQLADLPFQERRQKSTGYRDFQPFGTVPDRRRCAEIPLAPRRPQPFSQPPRDSLIVVRFRRRVRDAGCQG